MSLVEALKVGVQIEELDIRDLAVQMEPAPSVATAKVKLQSRTVAR